MIFDIYPQFSFQTAYHNRIEYQFCKQACLIIYWLAEQKIYSLFSASVYSDMISLSFYILLFELLIYLQSCNELCLPAKLEYSFYVWMLEFAPCKSMKFITSEVVWERWRTSKRAFVNKRISHTGPRVLFHSTPSWANSSSDNLLSPLSEAAKIDIEEGFSPRPLISLGWGEMEHFYMWSLKLFWPPPSHYLG